MAVGAGRAPGGGGGGGGGGRRGDCPPRVVRPLGDDAAAAVGAVAGGGGAAAAASLGLGRAVRSAAADGAAQPPRSARTPASRGWVVSVVSAKHRWDHRECAGGAVVVGGGFAGAAGTPTVGMDMAAVRWGQAGEGRGGGRKDGD